MPRSIRVWPLPQTSSGHTTLAPWPSALTSHSEGSSSAWARHATPSWLSLGRAKAARTWLKSPVNRCSLTVQCRHLPVGIHGWYGRKAFHQLHRHKTCRHAAGRQHRPTGGFRARRWLAVHRRHNGCGRRGVVGDAIRRGGSMPPRTQGTRRTKAHAPSARAGHNAGRQAGVVRPRKTTEGNLIGESVTRGTAERVANG